MRFDVAAGIAHQHLRVRIRVGEVAKPERRRDGAPQRFAADARIVGALDRFKRVEGFTVAAVVEEKVRHLKLDLGGVGRGRGDDGRQGHARRHEQWRPM